jgi:hypothetical protein
VDSRPQPAPAPTQPGTAAPGRSGEASVSPRPPAHDEVAEIGARVEEIVAAAPTTSADGRVDDSDPARPVEEASKHILLGPALATTDRLQSRLGKMLVHRGLVTQAELDQALERQGQTGERLGEALVAIDAVASGDVARVLAEHLRLPFIDLGGDIADMSLVGAISAAAARRYIVLPVARWGDRIVIAMANPNDAEIVDEVRRLVDAPVVVAVADPVVLRPLIAAAYGNREKSVDAPITPTVRGTVGVSSSEGAATVTFTCPGCQEALTLRAAPWVMTEVNRDPGRYYVWEQEPGDAKPVHVCPRS